jgi:formylglycine-generating enzyme required for sulfatase activity
MNDGAVPHKVEITDPFLIKKTEVTQKEWTEIFYLPLAPDPSKFSHCPECPVDSVTWYEAVVVANAMSSKVALSSCYSDPRRDDAGLLNPYDYRPARLFLEPLFPQGLTCWGIRLPTEAEWEYAVRAGTVTDFYNGSMIASGCSPIDPKLDAAGWFCGNAAGVPHPVAGKLTNPWGVSDMLGNVAEWVWDWYAPYTNTGTVNPVGPSTGTSRVIRGGSYTSTAANSRSGSRGFDDPKSGASNGGVGVRLVISLGAGAMPL